MSREAFAIHISREQVKEMAALAKLAVADEELDKFVHQLQGLLDYIDILKSIPSGEAEATVASEGEGGAWLGEAACLEQEQVLAMAPDSSQGLVRVPKVIDDEQ